MNSIRPLATVAVLGLIGVGLYMVINTSEPIPPDDAADAMLAVPEIEGDLAAMVDEGTPHVPEVEASATYASGEEMSAAPPWSAAPESPASESSPEWPESSEGAPALPEGSAAQSLPHSAEESMQSGGTDPFAGSGRNAFSAQIQSQVQNGNLSVVENPHMHEGDSPATAWGNIPSRSGAEHAASAETELPPQNHPGDGGHRYGNDAALAGPTTAGGGAILPVDPLGENPATPFSVAWAATQDTLRRGDLSQALLMLSEFYGDPQLTEAESEKLRDLLSQLAGTVIYSRSHELEEPYRVQPGETLADIALRYEVTPELLAKINGIADPHRLSPGTELKVVRGPFHAIIDESGLRLALRGRYAGRFSAQSPESWPVDSWTVQQKVPAADSSAGPSASSGKHIVLAPANNNADVDPVAVVADEAAPGEMRPIVRVSAQDMSDLYDILTIGSNVTVRR